MVPAPKVDDKLKATLSPLQIVFEFALFITGVSRTVMVRVATQPVDVVYVIVTEPVFTPVTKPELFTVANAVFEDVQGLVKAGVPDPVKFMVEPIQTKVFPDIEHVWVNEKFIEPNRIKTDK